MRWIQSFSMYKCIILLLIFHAEIIAAEDNVTCKDVPRVSQNVSKIRKLDFKRQVACQELSKKDFYQYKKELFLKFYKDLSLEKEGLVLLMLGIIPPEYNYSKCISEASIQDVLASYDVEQKKIIIPDWSNLPEHILAHELVHALQDQHFELEKKMNYANNLSDSALAMSSLAEGDALITQNIYQKKFNLKNKLQIPNEIAPESECSLPRKLIALYDFPYVYGYRFALRNFQNADMSMINRLYDHPPQSTSEIIHMDNEPRNFRRKKVHLQKSEYKDTLGQYIIMTVFKDTLSDIDALTAAKGWLDDNIEVELKHNKYYINWVSEWETESDSKEFMAAFIAYSNIRFAMRLDTAVDRILFELADRQYYSLHRTGTKVYLKFKSFLG